MIRSAGKMAVCAATLAACASLFDVDHDYSADAGGDAADGSADTGLDAPMDIQTPDLGTGETEAGLPCTCTPPVPVGWNIVSYDQKSRPVCPMGYGTPANLFENATAQPSTCACTCSSAPSVQPSCNANVTFNVQFSDGNNCGVTCANMITSASTCTNGSWNFPACGSGGRNWLKVSGAAPAPAGGACANPMATVTLPAKTSDQGRSCALSAAPGSCGMGACIPTPMTPDTICIEKSGVNVCPNGFPNTHYAGDGIADTRGCGPDPCTCTMANKGSCSTPNLSTYTVNNCSAQDLSISAAPADGVCRNVGLGGGSITYNSAKYDSTSSGAVCSYIGTFTPTGSVTVTNVRTICCL